MRRVINYAIDIDCVNIRGAGGELDNATARLVGPFASRDLARAADISDRTSPIVATL